MSENTFSKVLGVALVCLMIASMVGGFPSIVRGAGKFNIGDTVEVTANLNVRTGPGTGYPEITDPDYPGYAPKGTIGKVLSGPSSADGYIWWEVDFGPGLYSGWSVESGLEKVSQPPSSPTITSPGSSSQPGPEIDNLGPTLRWSGVSGADYCALAISKYPYGSSNIIYNPQQLYGTSHTVPSGTLEYGQKYRWNMQAHNSAGWSAVSNTLYFQTAPPSLPDLVVTDIQVEPSPPTPGGPTTIGITIKNRGNSDVTETFFLEFYFDSTYKGHVYIDGLSAGSSRTSYWRAQTWPSDTNLHRIRGAVDPDDTVSESNEGNNDLSKQLSATEPTNELPICSISADRRSGNAPLTVKFLISASDPDGSIAFWELDVDGDGTAEYFGSGNPPSIKTYTYQNPATFTAKLMVKDDDEAEGYCEQTIAVSESEALLPQPTTIEIANLSCHELSALGSAISKVLDEERKLGNIRKIAAARAQELAGEAEDVGGLFGGPMGFFREHLSSLGWIKVEPPENVVTLPIESEAAIAGIDAMANLVLMIFGGTPGVVGGAIITILAPLAKWGGKELATRGELGDIGYFRVTKPGYGTMDVIYSKETKEACVNIALEDLKEEWKEEYGWANERIYLYMPFDEKPPKLKKTDGEFDYKAICKAEAFPPSYFTFNKDAVEAAIEWATDPKRKSEDYWTRRCLSFVAKAFGEESAGYHHPNEMKSRLGDKFYSWVHCGDPPRGVLVFFSTSGEDKDYGHIGIYLGSRKVVHAYKLKTSSDYVREESISNVEKLPTVISYIGWAYPPEEWISGPAPVPPDTTITGGPSGTIDTDSATFSWSGNDDKTPTSSLVYSYYLEGYDSGWSAFTSTTAKGYSSLANGSYTFYVKARDQAGNVDPSPASRSFTVNVTVDDTVPPTTTITGGPSGTIDTDSATFTWSGSDNKTPTSSLVYSYYLRGYDSNWSTFTSATLRSYSGLANGNYNFYVVARDQAGNVDPSSASRSFTVSVATGDIVPPDTTITGGPSGTIETDSATFTWSGDDDKTPTSSLVYSYYLEGYDSNWSTFTSATLRSYSGLANGNYNFYVEARDQAGNVDPTPASRSFTVNVTGTAPIEPYLVDVGVSSETEPWPPRTFVQATPGDRIYTWYNIGYCGPRIRIRQRTAIVDPDGKQIPNQLGDLFLVLMEDAPRHTGWIGETFEIPADAVPAIYDVVFSIWSEDGTQEYDSVLKHDWLGLTSTE